MSKQEKINYINKGYEGYQTLSGRDSWNREYEIDVKLRCGYDIDKIKESLDDETLKIIEVLDLDLCGFVDRYTGDYNGLVVQARDDLERLLYDKFRWIEVSYNGRQGGWLCLILDGKDLDIDDIDDLDNLDNVELDRILNLITQAQKEYSDAVDLVNQEKKFLIELIENIETDDYLIEMIEIGVQDEKENLVGKLEQLN